MRVGDVARDEIESLSGFEQFQTIYATRHTAALVAFVAQHRSHDFTERLFVIHHKYAFAHTAAPGYSTVNGFTRLPLHQMQRLLATIAELLIHPDYTQNPFPFAFRHALLKRPAPGLSCFSCN